MKLHKAWWSAKQPAVKVTIVTGLNPSRVNQLESQCKSYKGPISASVYVVLHNPTKAPALTDDHKKQLEEAADLLESFHKR
jgi:glycosyltransferase-like protein LARGE